MREAAFDRFMADSAALHAAHYAPEKPYLRGRVVWVLRWLMWVFACGLVAMPAPLTVCERRPEAEAPQVIPKQTGASVREQAAGGKGVPAVPGAAIAAAVNGARAAREVIAARETRTSSDLAAAVRDSAAHWRGRPPQRRPRPTPGTGYMAAWEHAFDSGHTLILGAGGAA